VVVRVEKNEEERKVDITLDQNTDLFYSALTLANWESTGVGGNLYFSLPEETAQELFQRLGEVLGR